MTDRANETFETLKESMAARGLKWTRQRELIARVFFDSKGHLKVDELLDRVRRLDPRVSQATVYRTLKLLKECGLAEERRFDDGQARYEPADEGDEHHDHLICTRCNQIVEFVHDRIEALQDQVAKAHGFVVTHHRMELYGLCAKCRDRNGQAAGA
jgi:Fur family transcriptional regulator, ferric uptake regulator